MMESKDPNTGKLMFKVLKVGLACEACMKAGVASSCTHMYVLPVVACGCLWLPVVACGVAWGMFFFSHLPVVLSVCRESFRPPWKSASKFAMVKQIYSTQKGMFERESMGKCLPFL